MKGLEGLDISVAVRPHPASNMQYYREQISPYKNARLIAGGDIIDDIADADVVITSYFTALFESLLMGKPAIFYNLSEFVDGTEISKMLAKNGLARYSRPKEARKVIEAALRGEDIRNGHTLGAEALEFYCGKVDGEASRRVLDEIERMAGAKKEGSA
ncbi:Uncharacterised protein [uncultured archaeon]|nr:Uncharacterised protein [uncultured archaeon]